MAQAISRPPVKLILGYLFHDHKLCNEAILEFKKNYGEIDYQSPAVAFSHTDYYSNEQGGSLFKQFVSFEKLVSATALPEIKIFSNGLEAKFSQNKKKRLINLDPGYLTAAKLILATAKNQRHRIYLDRGIYAESELFYQNKSFMPWEWTYPDYRKEEYIQIFNHIRSIYVSQIKKLGLTLL